MLRNDGNYSIYCIQHRIRGDTEWRFTNFSGFGYPRGFSPSDPCGQQTGILGAFSFPVARAGLQWMNAQNAHLAGSRYEFRLVCVHLTQHTEEIL